MRSQNFKGALTSDLDESIRVVTLMKDSLVSDLANKLPVKLKSDASRRAVALYTVHAMFRITRIPRHWLPS